MAGTLWPGQIGRIANQSSSNPCFHLLTVLLLPKTQEKVPAQLWHRGSRHYSGGVTGWFQRNSAFSEPKVDTQLACIILMRKLPYETRGSRLLLRVCRSHLPTKLLATASRNTACRVADGQTSHAHLRGSLRKLYINANRSTEVPRALLVRLIHPYFAPRRLQTG